MHQSNGPKTIKKPMLQVVSCYYCFQFVLASSVMVFLAFQIIYVIAGLKQIW